jgi:lysozyme
MIKKILLFCSIVLVYSHSIENPTIQINTDIQELYRRQIKEKIKEHEGLVLNEYLCPANVKTIGYGNTSSKLKRITKQQADSLLDSDIEKAEKYLLAYMPKNNKMTVKQKYVAIHFIFCFGIGNFNKSGLKKQLIKGGNINEELKKWVYYRRNGEIIKSKNLEKIAMQNITFLEDKTLPFYQALHNNSQYNKHTHKYLQ